MPSENYVKSMPLRRTIANRLDAPKRVRLRRRGAAVIETALLLPLLVLLGFGSIELANMVFMKQTLSIAAYEGVRAATKPGAAFVQSDLRVQEVLASRGVSSYSIAYTTTNSAPILISPVTPRGTQLTVMVQSSNGGARYGPLSLFTGRTLRCQATMVRQ